MSIINPTERWLISPTSERPEYVSPVEIVNFDATKDVSKDLGVKINARIRPDHHILVIGERRRGLENALLGPLTRKDAYQNCHGLGIQVRHLYVLTAPSDSPDSKIARGALLLGKRQNEAFFAGRASTHNDDIGYDAAYGDMLIKGHVSTNDSLGEEAADRALLKHGYVKDGNFLYFSIRFRSES